MQTVSFSGSKQILHINSASASSLAELCFFSLSPVDLYGPVGLCSPSLFSGCVSIPQYETMVFYSTISNKRQSDQSDAAQQSRSSCRDCSVVSCRVTGDGWPTTKRQRPAGENHHPIVGYYSRMAATVAGRSAYALLRSAPIEEEEEAIRRIPMVLGCACISCTG